MEINKLQGEAYSEALYNVMDYINNTLGTDLFFARDWYKIKELALKLKLKFDEKGTLIF